MSKTNKKIPSILTLIIAVLLLGVGIFKCIDSTSMQSLKDSCTKDFDNISQSDCTTKYELMSSIHEESSRNSALICFALSVTIVTIYFAQQKH